MKDKESYRTGVIPCDERNLTFFLQDFCFHIMSSQNPDFFSNDLATLKSNSDNVVYCITHDNHDLAIITGRYEHSVYNAMNLITDAYIVCENNIQPSPHNPRFLFDSIEFYGGTLSKVFTPSSISIESDGHSSKLTPVDDSIRFTFKYGSVICTACISSGVKERYAISGTRIDNQNIRLQLKFDTRQTINEIMFHYHKICKLLSFMTFRSNVDFDKVSLIQHPEAENSLPLKWNLYYKCEKDCSNKPIMHCLSFHDLKDNIANLFNLIYSSTEKKPSYLLDFIPENDSSFGHINNDTIKAVCSALECELEFSEISSDEESQKIQQLAEQIKQLVKEHRTSASPLSPKSYDKIFGSIRHWSMATSDQINQLYLQHHQALLNLPVRVNTLLSAEDISAFVSYRNDITHGRYRVSNQRIAETTFVLEGLVYCCLLARIGLKENVIERLCQSRKILT